MKAIICGRIVPVTSAPIDNGIILVDDDGKLAAIGKNIAIPEGAEIINMDSYTAVPGLIDPHTYIALTCEPHGMNEHNDNDEITGLFNPHIAVIDGFYPDDEAINKARRAGFTTCFTAPGFNSVISGCGAAFKMKKSNSAEKMLIPASEQMIASFGQQPIKAAKGKVPMSHMSLFSELRDFLKKCDEYSRSESRQFDAKLEAMLPVMRGEMVLRVSVFKATDMIRTMEILDGYNIKYVFAHAVESYLIPDEIIKRNVSCIFTPIFSYPFRTEQWNIRSDTPVVMDRAGLRQFAFACYETSEVEFHRAWNGRYLALGMSEEKLLAAMTVMPAEILGISHRVGSLEAGKDADIAFFNGDALSNLSLCAACMIDGVMYDGQEAVK